MKNHEPDLFALGQRRRIRHEKSVNTLRIASGVLLIAYLVVFALFASETITTKDAVNAWLESHERLVLPPSPFVLVVPSLLLAFALWEHWLYGSYAPGMWLPSYLASGMLFALWYFGVGIPTLAVLLVALPLSLLAGLVVPYWGIGGSVVALTLLMGGL